MRRRRVPASTWVTIPPTVVANESFVRDALRRDPNNPNYRTQVSRVCQGASGAWYAGLTEGERDDSVHTIAIIETRTRVDAAGATVREFRRLRPMHDGAPTDCSLFLLERYRPQAIAQTMDWALASYRSAAAPPDSRPQCWRGRSARVQRSLDPAPLSTALLVRWASTTGTPPDEFRMAWPVIPAVDPLPFALVQRTDLPTAALACIWDRCDIPLLRARIAAHPALTAALVTRIIDDGCPSDILDALLRHPQRGALLAAAWERLVDHATILGPEATARVLLAAECPPQLCVTAHAAFRAMTADQGWHHPIDGDVVMSRVARALLIRRTVPVTDWLSLLAVAAPALRTDDLPRLWRRMPSTHGAVARSLLRASTNPAIVAAVTSHDQ